MNTEVTEERKQKWKGRNMITPCVYSGLRKGKLKGLGESSRQSKQMEEKKAAMKVPTEK